jgi:hypothetical protein
MAGIICNPISAYSELPAWGKVVVGGAAVTATVAMVANVVFDVEFGQWNTIARLMSVGEVDFMSTLGICTIGGIVTTALAVITAVATRHPSHKQN